ncbi:MAG TPA: TMEM175 family protein, partial [Saprospiraceae bacterium]|nr:TMEM175 family protein [Saprospiraceae bacterium]
ALTLLILEIKAPLASEIQSSADLWHSLQHLAPSFFAFLLSFAIIVISWVNHHALMKGINKSTPYFIYANTFLLLTIVIIPFPTELLAEFFMTNAASTAVVMYCLVILSTNIGWILITWSALKPKPLSKNEESKARLQTVHSQAKMAFLLYFTCTILAFWYPVLVSIIITLSWIFWLFTSITNRDNHHLEG